METFLITFLALMCTALPWWMGRRYGVIGLISPMHMLAYFCFFGFAAKAVAYTINPDLAFYRQYVDTPWAVQAGAIYLSGFVVLMCLGYRVAVRPVARAEVIAASRGMTYAFRYLPALVALSFSIAALTLILILQARGVSVFSMATLTVLNSAKQINVNADGVGATLAGIKTLFILPKLVFVMVLARAIVRPDFSAVFGLLVMTGLLLMIAVVSGDRFELAELMLMAAAVFAILGGRLGWRFTMVGLGGFCGLVILSAYMTTLRGADGGLWGQILGSTYFLDINVATLVVARVTPEMYLLGDSYTWWTFGWIPRAIWLEKPAIDLGVLFKTIVLGSPRGGAFNVTGPGEAFLNFGWMGMAVGFALGWVYRKLEVWLFTPAHIYGFASFLLYPLILLPFIQSTLHSSFSGFIVGAAAQLCLIIVVVFLFVPRFRSAGSSTQGAWHVA